MYTAKPRCNCDYIHVRYITLFLCCCFTTYAYIVRDLFFVTFDVWAKRIKVENVTLSNECHFTKEPFDVLTIKLPKDILHSYDELTIEAINNIYFMGALITKMPSGYMADKYGSRKMFLAYGWITMFLVCGSPTVIKYAADQTSVLMAWRFIVGVVSGPIFPCANGIIAYWSPINRRTTMIAFVNITYSVGSILSRIVARYIISYTQYWPSVFYITAGFLAITTLIWQFCGYSSPSTHPFISAKEKQFLEKDLGEHVLPYEIKKIPWVGIFTSIPFWASIINHFGRSWALYSLYFYMSIFFRVILNTHFKHNILVGIFLPFFIQAIATLTGGILCDYLVQKNIMDITTTRKVLSNFGAIGVSVYMITLTLVGCNQKLGYVLYMVLVAFMGFYETGVSANDIDLAPNYAATLKGVTQSVEHLVTFLVPLVMRKMTTNNTLQEWRSMFFVAFLVVMSSNMVFTVIGKARKQSWNQSQIKKT